MTLLAWAELDRERIAAALAEGAAAAMAVGAVEQHGSHLPTGTDFMVAAHVLDRAARAASRRVLVLPPLPFGLSHYHRRWGATIGLGAETLSRVLRDIAQSARDAGASELFIVNGHGGNRGICTTTSLDASTPDFRVHGFCYWDLVPEAARAAFVADNGSIGHAGQAETSIVLAVFPELCRTGVHVAHEPIGPAFGLTALQRLGETGVSGDPGAASSELGAGFLDAVVERLVALFDGAALAPEPATAR